MSFAFNFAVNDDGGVAAAAVPIPAQPHHTRDGERYEWRPNANWEIETDFVPVDLAADLKFEIVNASHPQFIARTGAISSILTISDLQTGVYEGGFKLWECAVDLVKYMAQQPQFQSLAGKRVTELGCGHGLPGVYALQRGAAHVAFMDYNKEVLDLTTCPNVMRNIRHDLFLYARTSFYAGAWGSVSDVIQHRELQDPEFDVILTAETIYTEAVAIELFEAIKCHLRRSPHAVALVAAKKYYFGTGGSIQHFLGLVQSDRTFQAEVVWEENDGRSNMRAILKVTHAV